MPKPFQFLVLMLLLCSIRLNGQVEITWTEPIIVAESQWGANLHPRLAVNEMDEVVVTWAMEGNAIALIQSAYLEADTFSDPQMLFQTWGGLEVGPDFGPNIAAASNDFVVVYRKGWTDGDVVSRKSTDGGANWQDEVWVDQFLFGDGAEKPYVAMDGEGNPHVSMIRSDNSDLEVGAICSVDQGNSYTAFIQADNNMAGTISSDPIISIEEDKHLVSWVQWELDEHHRLYSAVSTNNGASFDGPIAVYDFGQNSESIYHARPDSWISNDICYLCWQSLDSLPQIICTTVNLNGMQISDSVLPEAMNASQRMHTVSADDGNCFVFWQDDRNGMVDIFGAFSNDQFETFSLLSPFENFPTEIRFNPVIKYVNNTLHMIYIEDDSRNIMYMQGEVDIVNSVNELSVQPFNCYPNPASEQLFLNLSGNYLIEIFSVDGRIVLQQQNNGIQKIDISGLVGGSYLIRAQKENRIYQSSFVVQR